VIPVILTACQTNAVQCVAFSLSKIHHSAVSQTRALQFGWGLFLSAYYPIHHSTAS
jgi:hypothetical protein